MQPQLPQPPKKRKFCQWLGVVLLVLYLAGAEKVTAQHLPGMPVPVDSVREEILQRYLRLSFDLAFNKPDVAMVYGQQALTIARTLQKSDDEVKALQYIGYIFYDRSALDSAEVYFNQGLLISKNTGNPKGESDMLVALGQVYFQRQHFPKALASYHAALALLQQVTNAKPASGIYNNIALVYKAQGNFPQAVQFLLKALAINEKAADKRRIALNLSNLGYLYKQMDNLPQAQEVLIRSLALAREINNKKQIVDALINLSLIYNTRGSRGDTSLYTLSWKQLQEVVTLTQESKDKRSQAIAYHNLAEIALARQRLALSQQLADYSIKLKEEIGVSESLVYGYKQQAILAQKKGLQKEAVIQARKAVTHASNAGNLPVKKEALALYADILAANGEYNKAYDALTQYQKVADSLVDEAKVKSIAQAQIAYETNKKQQAIELLKKEKGEQQQQNIYIFLILAFIAACCFGFIFKQRRKLLLEHKQNAVQQLALQNATQEQTYLKKQLENYTQELIKSNEVVLQLEEQLAGTRQAPVSPNSPIAELNSLKVLREEDWDYLKNYS